MYDTVVAIDLETTGADPLKDQIIEIGAAVYKNGIITATFSELAKNEIPMIPAIIKLTGITPEMLEDKPPLNNIIDKFLDFLPEGAICIAHNANFERTFLKKATNNRFDNIVVDTVGLSRICFPELESHSLACLCDYLEVSNESAHRALSDCITLAKVWQILINKLYTLPLPVIGEINYLLASHPTNPYCNLFRKLEAEVIEKNFGHNESSIADIFEINDFKIPSFDNIDDKDDWVKLDRKKVEWVFEEGGFLEEAFDSFEPRSGQVNMTGEVVDAFNNGSHLLVEAGTGTGKSLAYLVPSVIWARENNVPVVISTNTKNLQTQLYEKDIPFVKNTLGIDFKAAIIKGRGNYLCIRKLLYVLKQADYELDIEERLQMVTVLSWAAWTETGDISDNIVTGRPGFFKTWAKMSCAGDDCLGRACKHYKRCFLWKARAKALNAEIIIANHSLVFSDMNMRSPNLPPYAQIIFDEAHNLEDAATSHLSVEISPLRVSIILGRLVHKGRKNNRSGLLPSIQDKVLNAVIEETIKGRILDNLSILPDVFDNAEAAADALFSEIDTIRHSGSNFGSLRFFAQRMDPDKWLPSFEAQKELLTLLAKIMHTLDYLIEDLKEVEDSTLEYHREFIRDLEYSAQAVREFSDDLVFTMNADNEEYVYWIEKISNKPGNVKLIAAPIEVGALLHDQLYSRKRSVVFASATMSVRGSFDYIKKRTGINLIAKDRYSELDAGSPFDYPKQCLVVIPTFLPEPGERGKDFSAELAYLLADVYRETHGRGMALYTSYEMLRTSYEILNEELLGDGIEILAQGMSGSRKNITSIFKRDLHSVLLGTHSFWEGVDVVGETLSCLTIARLPFAVYTEPLIEARCQKIEAEGGNAFIHYSIPNAIIKFRQGFGRLIRHKGDRGVVIIADRRIISKRYGKTFKDSLPCSTYVYENKDKMMKDIQSFLGL